MSAVDEVGFSCAACGKQYRWKPELAGKKVKCKCGNALAVPATPPTPGQAGAAAQPGLAAAARSAEVRPRTAAPGRPANAPPPPPPARKAKEPTEDDGGMDALLALAQQEADVAEDATAGADLNFCPNCRNRMNPDAVLCTACGYNRKSGKMVSAAAPKVAKSGGGFLSKLKGQSSDGKVDKMAPQGSFILGLLLSGAFAAGASILWILVAWLTKYEVAFLVLAVGAAAGVGMQVGQKGYSKLGGLAAAGITFLVMGVARLLVFLLIVMSAAGSMKSALADAGNEDEDAMPSAYDNQTADGGTKDPKTMALEMAERAAKIKAKQQAEWDRQAAESAKKNPPPPPPDPLIVEKLADDFMANEMKIDKKFATPDQHNAAFIHGTKRAQDMPLADREKMLVPLKAKRDRERAEEELLSLEHTYQFETKKKENPDNPGFSGPNAWTSAGDVAKRTIEKMSPEEKKAELARLKEWGKAEAAAERKEWAEEEKKAKAEEAKAAVEDGFGEAPPAPAPAAAGGAPAPAGGDDGLGGGTPVAAAPAAPAPAAAADADADPDEDDEDATAASPSANKATASNSGSNSSSSLSGDEESSDGSGAGTLILGIVLFYIFVGGIFPGIFLLSALFLAYRTGAGATWG